MPSVVLAKASVPDQPVPTQVVEPKFKPGDVVAVRGVVISWHERLAPEGSGYWYIHVPSEDILVWEDDEGRLAPWVEP